MQQKLTKTQNGTHGLPASIKRNVEIASYENYDRMNIKSIEALIENRNHIATLREISIHRNDGNAVIASIFARSMDKVKNLTGVKNWMGLEGIKFFMDEVMDRYAKPDPHQIQLTPVDIQIFCRKIIVGQYGEYYENISVPKLLTWLDEYVNERSQVIKSYRQNKERNNHDGEIDREGLKRMAETFERVHKKHIAKELSKQPAYLSMQQYIDRNNLDPDEFWKNRELEFETWCEDVESSSDSGKKIRDQGPDIKAAYKRIFTMNWLTKQNQLLNQNKPK